MTNLGTLLVLVRGGRYSDSSAILRNNPGLKTVTAELPQEGKLPEKACAKLAPKLLAQVEKSTTPPETVIEMLSILSILVSRFPVYLADVYPSPIVTFTPLLSHPRSAVRKRAVFALAQFLPTASEQTFDKLLKSTIQPALSPTVTLDHQRTIILLVGAIARFAPQQIGPVLNVIVPSVLSAASRDDVELREVCLQVRIIEAGLLFISLSSKFLVSGNFGAQMSFRNYSLPLWDFQCWH